MILEMLHRGFTYDEISRSTGWSTDTIAEIDEDLIKEQEAYLDSLVIDSKKKAA